MIDADKTKAELINELTEMHRRITELEALDAERRKVLWQSMAAGFTPKVNRGKEPHLLLNCR